MQVALAYYYRWLFIKLCSQIVSGFCQHQYVAEVKLSLWMVLSLV